MSEKNYVENFYQGIFLTETILGNPNGDFVDNSPRNIDGKVFTTDKCIKYNVRKYLHDVIENEKDKENIVFFFPRLHEDATFGDSKYKTIDQIYNDFFGKEFANLVNNSIDVKMFGGTFSFSKGNPKQIYGPIQISYGVDINDAQIERIQIGSPFSRDSKGSQKTYGSEYIVDDAIISYDITVNPNNAPKLLSIEDFEIFKESLWFGTNSRKTSSKKTDSKFLMLIKFKNRSEDGVSAFNIGELNKLISIENKRERKNNPENQKIKLNLDKLKKKLHLYEKFIESVDVVYDEHEIELDLKLFEDKSIEVTSFSPVDLYQHD